MVIRYDQLMRISGNNTLYDNNFQQQQQKERREVEKNKRTENVYHISTKLSPIPGFTIIITINELNRFAMNVMCRNAILSVFYYGFSTIKIMISSVMIQAYFRRELLSHV